MQMLAQVHAKTISLLILEFCMYALAPNLKLLADWVTFLNCVVCRFFGVSFGEFRALLRRRELQMYTQLCVMLLKRCYRLRIITYA